MLQSIRPSASASAWTSRRIRSQVPSADQRRCRSCTVFHLPNRGGRSRQGMPVRSLNKIPLITLRWQFQRPPRPTLVGRWGTSRAHSPSERSPLPMLSGTMLQARGRRPVGQALAIFNLRLGRLPPSRHPPPTAPGTNAAGRPRSSGPSARSYRRVPDPAGTGSPARSPDRPHRPRTTGAKVSTPSPPHRPTATDRSHPSDPDARRTFPETRTCRDPRHPPAVTPADHRLGAVNRPSGTATGATNTTPSCYSAQLGRDRYAALPVGANPGRAGVIVKTCGRGGPAAGGL
ncbi:hypothetical protein K377_06161 [Streptomyces sp. PsTaAH-137]|nr:hypothetical protein K377_06161 [Streptomyces sp. PsTaAH-137]